MKWTLLVPGALLPAGLAPEIARAMKAPRLARRLGAAQARPSHRAPERSAGAAHWSWLAHALGLDDPPVTAPYAWRALALGGADAGRDAATDATEPLWIAHADPVHMAIARDHMVLSDLGEEPLQGAEADALLELANEAAASARAAGTGLDVQFTIRAGHWFLCSAAPLAVQTDSLDAVLGRSVQEHLPTGAHARALRVLCNEIQMLWHASAVQAAREQRGARPVNALWIHGGGSWQALPPRGLAAVAAAAPAIEAAVLQGWHQAGAGQCPPGTPAPQWTLALDGQLFGPHARQDWEQWLARVPSWEQRLEDEIERARAGGAGELELVLGGATQSRTWAIRLRSSWRQAPAWGRALGLGRRAAALGDWLTEEPDTGAGQQQPAGGR